MDLGGMVTTLGGLAVDETRPFELLTKRVSRTFFVELYKFLDLPDTKCLRLVVISPWITEFADDQFRSPTLSRLVRYKEKLGIFKAVTRNPRLTFPMGHQQRHEEGVRILKEAGADVVFLNGLHTKLLGAQIHIPVAPGKNVTDTITLFGSANLTLRSQYNIELGLFTRSVGWGEVLNKEILEIAEDLYLEGKREMRVIARKS